MARRLWSLVTSKTRRKPIASLKSEISVEETILNYWIRSHLKKAVVRLRKRSCPAVSHSCSCHANGLKKDERVRPKHEKMMDERTRVFESQWKWNLECFSLLWIDGRQHLDPLTAPPSPPLSISSSTSFPQFHIYKTFKDNSSTSPSYLSLTEVNSHCTDEPECASNQYNYKKAQEANHFHCC